MSLLGAVVTWHQHGDPAEDDTGNPYWTFPTEQDIRSLGVWPATAEEIGTDQSVAKADLVVLLDGIVEIDHRDEMTVNGTRYRLLHDLDAGRFENPVTGRAVTRVRLARRT